MENSLPPLPWTYRFEPRGGYDSMSSAYVVSDANGESLFAIDSEAFDDGIGDYEPHNPCARAEAVARFICERTLSAGDQPGEGPGPGALDNC